MQFLLDNLAAVLVGSVVLLIVAAVSLSAQQSALDATQVDARFASATALAEMVESDVPNVGAGVPAGDPRIHDLTGTALTTAFEFSGAVDPSATAAVERVRYEVHQTGTLVLGENGAESTVPTYEVRRLVHDGTAFHLTGQSQGAVTEFSVQLLTAAGAPVGADLDEARVAVVQIASATPLGQGQSASVSRWQRRFQLTNLAAG